MSLEEVPVVTDTPAAEPACERAGDASVMPAAAMRCGRLERPPDRIRVGPVAMPTAAFAWGVSLLVHGGAALAAAIIWHAYFRPAAIQVGGAGQDVWLVGGGTAVGGP